MKAYMRFLVLVGALLVCVFGFCQQKRDSLVVRNDSIIAKTPLPQSPAPSSKDSVRKRIWVPRVATIRSAIFPGLGQIYNRKYWKLPLVYGALGTTAVVFRFNIVEYNKIRFAYNTLINKDTANFKNVDTSLIPFVRRGDLQGLRVNRNEFRKNIDYSVLVFMLFWALNVVDATVDAHLKNFDVSSDLSLKLKPTFNSGPAGRGLSLVFDIHKSKPRLWALP